MTTSRPAHPFRFRAFASLWSFCIPTATRPAFLACLTHSSRWFSLACARRLSSNHNVTPTVRFLLIFFNGIGLKFCQLPVPARCLRPSLPVNAFRSSAAQFVAKHLGLSQLRTRLVRWLHFRRACRSIGRTEPCRTSHETSKWEILTFYYRIDWRSVCPRSLVPLVSILFIRFMIIAMFNETLKKDNDYDHHKIRMERLGGWTSFGMDKGYRCSSFDVLTSYLSQIE